ncbi:hypothetical protein BDQ17DRAFT_1431197 [Cyathus striatus]|nr:hypothetical protein BDQ17DRAFT_1431197 [Cyathus striatus]
MSGFSLDQYVQSQIDVEIEKPQFPFVTKSTTRRAPSVSAYRAVLIAHFVLDKEEPTSLHIAALTGAIGGTIVSAIAAGPFICTMACYSELWEKRLSFSTTNVVWIFSSVLFNFVGVAIGAAIVKKMMLDSIVIGKFIVFLAVGLVDVATVAIFLIISVVVETAWDSIKHT